MFNYLVWPAKLINIFHQLFILVVFKLIACFVRYQLIYVGSQFWLHHFEGPPGFRFPLFFLTILIRRYHFSWNRGLLLFTSPYKGLLRFSSGKQKVIYCYDCTKENYYRMIRHHRLTLINCKSSQLYLHGHVVGSSSIRHVISPAEPHLKNVLISCGWKNIVSTALIISEDCSYKRERMFNTVKNVETCSWGGGRP